MTSAITKGLKRGNAGFAARQAHDAIALVNSESPIRGKQPLSLAAGQLAILFANNGQRSDFIADRLLELGDDAVNTHNYDPHTMVEQVLSADELNVLPQAKVVVGLIAGALKAQGVE